MRKLIEKRGVILRGLLLAVSATVSVVLVTLSAVPGEDGAESLAASVAAEREAAHALLRSGEIEAGAVALLDSVRNLPDDPALLDAAHGTLQLLAFAMAGLMPDDRLDAFLLELDPASWPVDALVLAYYARETEQYASWRGFDPFDAATVWQEIDALSASPSALVRAGGNLMAASPYLWTRIGIDEVGRMLEATNALAAALPSGRRMPRPQLSPTPGHTGPVRRALARRHGPRRRGTSRHDRSRRIEARRGRPPSGRGPYHAYPMEPTRRGHTRHRPGGGRRAERRRPGRRRSNQSGAQ
jgi:hypothetical protein